MKTKETYIQLWKCKTCHNIESVPKIIPVISDEFGGGFLIVDKSVKLNLVEKQHAL